MVQVKAALIKGNSFDGGKSSGNTGRYLPIVLPADIVYKNFF